MAQSALTLDIMCNTVYSDVMQTIGASDPTLPQQPIPTQAGIAVVDVEQSEIDVLPLSARCRYPAVDDYDAQSMAESTSESLKSFAAVSH